MTRAWSLRRRIVVTYAALTVAVCGVFAAMIFVTVMEVEDRLVYQRLHSQAEAFIERHRRGEPPPHVKDMHFFHGGNAPAEFAGLTPGMHDTVRNGRDVHVFVREDGGEVFVLVDEEQAFWLIEKAVGIALALGVVAALVTALLLARLTVNRVVAPLTELAEAVQTQGHDALPSLQAEDEIGTLARALAQRTGALERFLERERRFTGDVSHELRTPLTVISGAAEVLAAHAEKQPALRPLVERIGRAAADATERVNGLLMLARTAQEKDAASIELAPLVQQEADRCRVLLASKPVVLNVLVEDSAHAAARPELVAILVGNLVRNACQYTSRGAVTVTLAPGILTVDDTGPGLPPPVRERLSRRAEHAAPAAGGGDGLGLSIVRRIAEHLHWTLRFEERRGGGTRVSLLMPPLQHPLTPS
jgi:signal transduction histidine kinase